MRFFFWKEWNSEEWGENTKKGLIDQLKSKLEACSVLFLNKNFSTLLILLYSFLLLPNLFTKFDSSPIFSHASRSFPIVPENYHFFSIFSITFRTLKCEFFSSFRSFSMHSITFHLLPWSSISAHSSQN